METMLVRRMKGDLAKYSCVLNLDCQLIDYNGTNPCTNLQIGNWKSVTQKKNAGGLELLISVTITANWFQQNVSHNLVAYVIQ